MNKETQIQLTPAELSFCVTLASQRMACKPETDRFLAGNMSAFGSHLVGVIGEFAARRVYGGKVNQKISANGDKHASDIIVDGGRSIEVKTITFSGKDPMLKLTEDELIDGLDYVLVQLLWPDKAIIFPPISVDDVLIIGEAKDFGYGKRTVVTAKQIIELCQST